MTSQQPSIEMLRPLAKMRTAGTVILLGLVLNSPCWAAAERWAPDSDTCNQESTTYAIASCLDGRAKIWDKRLNEAYQALLAVLNADPNDKPRIEALRTAQRAWLQYRRANCSFYETASGTIRLIEVATCNRDMTQDRAIELRSAGPQG